jgi:hypothetical protein
MEAHLAGRRCRGRGEGDAHGGGRDLRDRPAPSATGGSLPGEARSRELGLIILAIPRRRVREEDGRRLSPPRALAEQEEATGARLLIDPGDGKPIPLHQAMAFVVDLAFAYLTQAEYEAANPESITPNFCRCYHLPEARAGSAPCVLRDDRCPYLNDPSLPRKREPGRRKGSNGCPGPPLSRGNLLR